MKNKAIIFKADYGFNLAHNQNDDECVLSLQIYTLFNKLATLFKEKLYLFLNFS